MTPQEPEMPQTAAVWDALIDDIHAEFDQGHMRAWAVVERHRERIEAEASHAATAAARAEVARQVRELPDSVSGDPSNDGQFESGWVNRAAVLALVEQDQ